MNDSRFSELVRSFEAYSNSNGTLRPPVAVLNAGIDAIGKFLFQPEATMAVVRYFLPIVPELVSRRLSAHTSDVSLEDYENLCLSASLILQVLPSMLFKFLKLLKSADSPFRRVELNEKVTQRVFSLTRRRKNIIGKYAKQHITFCPFPIHIFREFGTGLQF